MFSQMGAAIGLLFCLYTVLFRWKALVAKYGTLSLYWWIVGVTVGCSLVGFLTDIAIRNA
jgi:hypothetical protein